MKAKRFIALFLSLAMILAFSACGGNESKNPQGSSSPSGSAAPSPESSQAPVSSSAPTGSVELGEEDGLFDEMFAPWADYAVPEGEELNVLYLASWAGAEYFVNSYNAWKPLLEEKGIMLELQGPQEFTDESQLNQLEMALASQSYDCIIFYPITPSVYATYMEDFWNNYQTPILCYGFDESCGSGHYFAGNDYAYVGKLLGEAILDYVEDNSEHYDQMDKIPVMLAKQSSVPELLVRVTSAWDVLEATGRFEVVMEQEVEMAEQGTDFAERLMSSNPDIEIIIVQSDDVGIAMSNAFDSASVDLSDTLSIWGFDATSAAVDIIKADGYFKGSIAYPHEIMGEYLGTILPIIIGAAREGQILDLSEAGRAGLEVTNVPITKENVLEWFPD